ncbi:MULTISPECIES: hypothetical protein [unclassified Saccharibacter]|uniref:hypothetical protein n=1 Tax=unclassified Saccharibacter TaxID=2648722 RepID=UPI0013276764|nr:MULTISPECIES: hypothetical protein [unclassified Saccharibacter]MXV35856.1 hypothetical protein [Saccharibacter sp. EH611]MXV57976.1 hypothetical protein [Saccharibacter sp. EH70]MXV66371.1 hypothetical protein [Saccharibacter sp. EH60]
MSRYTKAAGLSRPGLYARRERDAEFAQEWDEAISTAIDTLEEEAWRRARDGVPEYLVTGKGLVLDKEGNPIMQNRYSDSLLTTLLKAHRPERYRERSTVEMNVTGSLAERLDEARKRVQTQSGKE